MLTSPASARSRLYGLLSVSLSFPGEAFYESAASGSLAAEIETLVSNLPFALQTTAERLYPRTAGYEEFQSQYIANFEIGVAGPPCPLYAGMYMGGRTAVWEELIRFYNLFGLHLSPENRDLPDHISTEFEFMHFLAWKEAVQGEAGSLQKAERDFLERQVLPWIGALRRRVESKAAPDIYQCLIELAGSLVRADHSYLRRQLAMQPASSL